MDTKLLIETDMREAMRAKDALALRTLRMVISAIKFNEIEKGQPLSESDVTQVLQKEIKSRHETIADAEKAGRSDLIAAGQAEVALLEKYLPKQFSDEALTELVKAAIAEAGASVPADMGKVMKLLMPKVQGKAAGDKVSQKVRSLLAG
jgi:uncharacterized protein YqeY